MISSYFLISQNNTKKKISESLKTLSNVSWKLTHGNFSCCKWPFILGKCVFNTVLGKATL